MIEPGRKFVQGVKKYRYGFNGKENDNEVKGEGNQQDYGMRIYDPRLGRFLSEDPITKQYPELTPYQFASNRPIDGIDRDGLEFEPYSIGKAEAKNREWADNLRKTDPENAERLINNANLNAFLIVMSPFSFGSSTAIKILAYGYTFYQAQRVIGIMNKPGVTPEQRNKNAAELKEAAADIILGWGVGKGINIVAKVFSGGKAIYKTFNSNSIRTTQTTVNGVEENTVAFSKEMKYTAEPIDIVKMEDGIYSSADHGRLMAAEKLGIDVKANTHNFNDKISIDQAKRFVPKGTAEADLPKTWGEAIKERVKKQGTKYATENPNGSFIRPKVKS